MTAFAEETHTATFIFDRGTLHLGDVETTESPYELTFTVADGFTLGSITDCGFYELSGWKCIDPVTGEDLGTYPSGTYFESDSDLNFVAVYNELPGIAITVDGFQVGNTLNDITFSFASTNLGVTFREGDITSFGCFDAHGELGEIGSGHVFQADTSYRFSIVLDNKGLELLPAVTVNGETPSCNLATSNGKPVTITIEYVATPAERSQYTITYEGGEGIEGSIPAGVKTHGEDFTLSSETFTMDGYVQTGWVDKETGEVYALGDTYTENADVTLNPYFEKIITLTVPFTTTVKVSGNASPGETTFNLQVLDSSGEKLSSDDVEIQITSVKTNGAGSYDGTLTIDGTSKNIAKMFMDKVFVKQAEGDYPNWDVDDMVWGLVWQDEVVALASADSEASDNSVFIFPAEYVETENGGYYETVEGKDDVDKMTFTNTYTKSVSDPSDTEGTASGDADNDSKADAEDSAKTGDNTNLALWLALLLLSGAGITGVTAYTRRKITNE